MKHFRIQMNAGMIQRYHTLNIIGEQTVATHTYGVCQILRYIYEDKCPPCLINAALDHDVPEMYTGDLPYNVKKRSHSLRTGLRELEKKYVLDGGTAHDLTISEKRSLKFADLMEMGLFGVYQKDMGNKNGLIIMNNVYDALAEIEMILPRAVEMKEMLGRTIDESE